MNKANMINPANYYNPFAKYNYVSKTRGVYFPKDSAPLLNNVYSAEKSTSIYSDNYDAESDLLAAMNTDTDGNNLVNKVTGFLQKFLN